MSSIVIEPVRRSVGVDCDIEQAWEVFTSGIYTWWPADTHSIAGEDVRDIVFEGQAGGQVYEVAADGSRHAWADVLEWEPPHRLVLAWDTGASHGVPTEVEVRFTAFEDGSGTRVELEHRGWNRWEDGESARANYDTGWELVLGRFAERANGR
jgi:uncharacterized protein YndB with AHSA1/START domain